MGTVLRALLAGQAAVVRPLDQRTRERVEAIVLVPAPVIILPGVAALIPRAVRRAARHRVWIECGREVREARQLARFLTEGWYKDQFGEADFLERVVYPKRLREEPICSIQKRFADTIVDTSPVTAGPVPTPNAPPGATA
jgi:uridine kinase